MPNSRPRRPLDFQRANSFECAIVRATDTDYRDPVCKITVTLDFTESSKLDSLTVIHPATSGATYSRSDQYKKAARWQTQGKKRMLLEGYLEQGLCCHNSW